MPRKPKQSVKDDAEGSKKAKKARQPARASRKPQDGKKASAGKKTRQTKLAPSDALTPSEGLGVPADTSTTASQRGRPSDYKPEYARIARTMCRMGAGDAELADAFGVQVSTIWRWQSSHEDFCSALKVEKGEYDDRVKRSLAQRAMGYTYEAVKIFMPAGATEPVYAKYMEHVPPDPGAAKIWLCNRQPDEWRDRKEFTGKDGVPLIPVLEMMHTDGRSQSSA